MFGGLHRRSRRLATTTGLLAIGLAGSAHAGTIKGSVFTDYNANGVFNGTATTAAAQDTGLGGVTVSGYQDGTAAAVASATTAADGSYTLTVPGTALTRVEFTGLPAGDAPTASGSLITNSTVRNRTAVQFVTPDSTAANDVSLGVEVPEDYCQDNPLLITCKFDFGPSDYATRTNNTDKNAVVGLDYSSGTTPSLVALAKKSQVGAVYGEAIDPVTGDVYVSAYLKRHVGYGPSGPGGIYRIARDAAAASGYDAPVAYTTVTGAGADDHVANGGDFVHDTNAAFDDVGKASLGDMDISQDGRTLYVTNLKTNALVSIDVASKAQSATPVPAPSTCGTASDWSIFGLNVHRGKVYVGGVCNDASGATTLRATVDRVDTSAFTPVFGFNLANTPAGSYPRKCAEGATNGGQVYNDGTNPDNCEGVPRTSGDWHPWISSAAIPAGIFTGNVNVDYPQPMLSDIEFDGNDLVLGLRDRFADQQGEGTYSPVAGDNTLYHTKSAGDTLRACASGTGFALESNGTCGTRTSGGVGSGEGPGGGEFYNGDDSNPHDQTFLGGLTQVPGYTNVASTEFDPIPGSASYYSGGVQWATNANGARERTTKIYQGNGNNQSTTGQSADGFGKANGLGDLEARCLSAPLEIGNRIWLDSDRDGTQDPGEPGIANVTVGLYSAAGTLITTTTTDATGNYYFAITPGLGYQVRVAPTQSALSGYSLTTANTGANSGQADQRDSDATLVGANDVITVPAHDPGVNDHSFDIGFVPAQYDLALTKKRTGTGPVVPGEKVTFPIQVTNQATDAGSGVQNVQVTDYLPAGFTYTAADNTTTWTQTGNLLTTTIAGPIAPNTGGTNTATVTLVLRVADTQAAGTLTNRAEISRFENRAGVGTDAATNPIVDVDSTPDQDPTNDGEGTPAEVNDATNGNHKTNPNQDEDDEDLESVNVSGFDLALQKTTPASVVAPGEVVPFDIKVINQGAAEARNVQIEDYVPAGYAFIANNDPDNPNLNPDWTLNTTGPGTTPRAEQTIASVLPGSGNAVTKRIWLRVAAGAGAQNLTNKAEIESFEDTQGGTPPDVDSTPDSDGTNDTFIPPSGDINGNAKDPNAADKDEDDEDEVTPGLTRYDLALTKTTTATRPVAPGDTVTFNVNVFNQSSAGGDVKNVQLTDTIPAGLAFDTAQNPGWTRVGTTNQVQYTLAGPIAAGNAATPTTVPIKLTVGSSATGTLVNNAEISEFRDTSSANGGNGLVLVDADSTPDTDPNNDTYSTNDDTQGDAKDPNAPDRDEDDADREAVTVATYDLALTKTTTSTVVSPGDTVPFTISVFNQSPDGSGATVKNVVVTDTIPAGYAFDATANPGWTQVGTSNRIRFTIAGPIAPGPDPTTVPLSLTVTSTAVSGPNGNLTNQAEITDFQNQNGVSATSTPGITDVDSTPGNGSTTEDDDDQASVTLAPYDLALTKSDPTGPVSPGDRVSYTLTVANQRTEARSIVKNVTISDKIPAGLTFPADPSVNPGWTPTADPTVYTYTIAGPLGPGDTAPPTTLQLDVATGATSSTVQGNTGNTLNRAEISRFENLAGVGSNAPAAQNPPVDVDSTPDARFDNDGEGTAAEQDGVTTGNHKLDATQDEDDEDPAPLSIVRYDLALTKVRTNGDTAAVAPGSKVPFTITVLNQSPDAGAVVRNVHVIDTVPAGYDLAAALTDNPGWTQIGTTRQLQRFVATQADLPSGLAPGASTTTSITLSVATGTTTAANDALRNVAQISTFGDAADAADTTKDTPRTDDIDSNLGTDPTVASTEVDNATDGHHKTDAGDDEDSQDFESVPLARYDLALTKATTSSNVAPGDDVPFTITVSNGSPDPAAVSRSFVVTDHIPAGMAFIPVSGTETRNAGWTVSTDGRTATRTITPAAPGLAPGDSTSVPIYLRVLGTATEAQLINDAEIQSFTDAGGNSSASNPNVKDIDSTPGNNSTTEDDDDQASVTLARYDLALQKTTTASRVAVGDTVPFTLHVINQATDARAIARVVTLVDYVPAGFEYVAADNPGWTLNTAGQPQYVIGDQVPPNGGTYDVIIRLRVKPGATDDTLVNAAEIAAFQGVNQPGINLKDQDSTPDDDPTNDGLVIDNDVTGNHKQFADQDEDDEDIAPVTLARYDLALRKTTTVSVANPGELVPFRIEVFNQSPDAEGTVSDATVTDTIPAGFTFDPNENPGWTDAGNGQVQAVLAGPIAPGASVLAPTLQLRVAGDAPDGTRTNTAEISAFHDLAGTQPPDIDSTPDTDPSNDATVDDVIDNAGGDEDDSDIANVEVAHWDLALRKTVGTAPVKVGQAVPFTITVFNQATSPVASAANVVITDTIPAGFEFRASDNPGWADAGNGQVSTAIPGPIAAGDSATTGIVLRVRTDATDAGLANIAEISSFTDAGGQPRPDSDSTPDTDPFNDNLSDDVIDNAGGDEDDNDIARVSLAAPSPGQNGTEPAKAGNTQLKIRKTLLTKGLVSGKKANWKLTVTNVGPRTARNVVVCDVPTSEVVYVSATAKVTLVKGQACFKLGDLAPGRSRSLTVRTRITGDAKGTVLNKATAKASNAKLVRGSAKAKTKAKPARGEGVTG